MFYRKKKKCVISGTLYTVLVYLYPPPPLHVWCYCQNEEKDDNEHILFHTCTVDKNIRYNISRPIIVNVDYFRKFEKHSYGP